MKNRIALLAVLVISLLSMTAIGIAAYRLHRLNFNMDGVLPKRLYSVTIEQSFVGHGMPVELNTYLPQNEFRQRVISDNGDASGLRFESFADHENKRARWYSGGTDEKKIVRYNINLVTEAVAYELDRTLTIAEAMESVESPYLEATDDIQVNSRDIQKAARRRIPNDGTVYSFLYNVFSYVRSFRFKAFKGTTDALTALKLKEASCNGRSRLMVAMLRSQGIPSRLVGGLVMRRGEKKTSHQWVEVKIKGTWLPIDPTNGYFLRIPHHYIVLYRGDEVLFTHTSDIAFDYKFIISSRMVPAQEVSGEKQFLGFTHIFLKLGIPIELLKSIIMIPLGALIVVMFRNVIGMRTFGTFLPALIAVACRNTGLLYGLLGFIIIIGIVSLLRHGLSKMQLLHSPQLGVMVTVVIGLLLGFAVIGDVLQLQGLAKVSLFPMVIVAITAERFSLMEIEEGRVTAWTTMAQSLIVMSLAYLVMSSLSLQVIMLSFPELLLVVAALNIWIGRWVGLRASEWLRFKGFVFSMNGKDTP